MNDSGWLRPIIVSVIVGGIVGGILLVGQIVVNPIIAKGEKREESILERRDAACSKAAEILQQRLASVKLTGPTVPKTHKPPEKSPTQFEVNTTYANLVLYCKDASIANKFKELVKCQGITQEQVGEFFLQLRQQEMELKNGGLAPKDFRYIYGWQKEKDPNQEVSKNNK